MATNTFTWYADLGAKRDMKPSIHLTKFGDGYEARTPIGVNFMPKKWSVTFTRNYAESSLIFAFLETQAGYLAFNWVDPLSVTGVYVCRDWAMSQKEFGIYEVNGIFEQIFES